MAGSFVAARKDPPVITEKTLSETKQVAPKPEQNLPDYSEAKKENTQKENSNESVNNPNVFDPAKLFSD